MIERDEFDQGPRNVFNYGHSFGHALEVSTNYEVPHGIAVSYGMDLANIISARLGLIPISLRNRIRSSLSDIWEGTPVNHVACSIFLEALTHDKKNEGNQIKVILTKGLGQMFKTTLEMNLQNTQTIQSFFNDKLYLESL
jgi:3-dehydroquinate synthase